MKFRLNISAPNVSLFFISLMLILPFLFPNPPKPIPTFYKEWLGAACAFLAFIPLIKQTAWPSYQAPTIIWLPIGMLGVMGIQLAVLDIAYWQHYFLVAQYFIFAALLVLLGGMLKQAIGFEKTMPGIAKALLISGLLSLMVVALDMSNIHLAGWVFQNKSNGAIANVGQQNHLATLFALALASLAYLFVKQSVKAWLAWPLMVALLSGLALTSSRSAWVFVTLIVVTALVYQHLQRTVQVNNKANAKRLVGLLALPVLFYAVQIGLPYLPSDKPITTTNQRLVDLAQKKDSPRLQIFQASWHVYADNPLLGTGFGQMAWHDINHAERVPKLTGTISHAHNLLLQFLAETGVLGTTVLLVCLLAFFFRVKSSPITPERWLWWLMLAIIGFHAMLEYPLWHTYFLALVALLLGVGDSQSHSLKRLHPQLLVTVFAMLWLASLAQTMHDFRIVQRWFFQNQHVNLSPQRYDLMYQQFQPIRAFSPLAVYAEIQLINTLPINREGLKDKIAIYERLLKAYPTPGLTYNYGILLALNGLQVEAIQHLKHTFIRYPEGIDQHWQKAAKTAVQGERMLFEYIKYIEHLRDNEPLNKAKPVIMDNQTFDQSPVSPSPESERG